MLFNSIFCLSLILDVSSWPIIFYQNYFLQLTLPLHSALFPDHVPDALHVLFEDPDSLYPWLHLYLTVLPKVKTLPVLLPLEGVPGSPQSITKQKSSLER